MKHQRNLVQSKIINTTPEKDLNDMDLVTLPEREFNIKIINMRMEVQKDIHELRHEFSLDWSHSSPNSLSFLEILFSLCASASLYSSSLVSISFIVSSTVSNCF